MTGVSGSGQVEQWCVGADTCLSTQPCIQGCPFGGMKLANSDMIYTMDIGKHYKQIKAGEGE